MFLTHRLPDEIHVQILSWLDVSNRRANFRALCLTNRNGYRLATPRLYQTIGFDVGGMRRHERLQKLCKAILYNPTLLSHVDTLHQYVGLMPGLLLSPLSDCMGLCRAALSQSGLDASYHEPILKQLAGNPWYGRIESIAFLIMLCRRLGTSSSVGTFKLYFDWSWFEADMLSRTLSSLGQRSGLCTVKNIELHDVAEMQYDCGFSLAEIMMFLQLPSLRSLVISRLGRFGYPDPFTLNRPERVDSALESLEILIVWYMTYLESLLALCPRLKSLTVRWPSRWSPRGSLARIDDLKNDWEILVNALQRLANLETLQILHCTENYLFSPFRGWDNPPLRSLCGVGTLKVLTISDIALVGIAGFDPGKSSHGEGDYVFQQAVLASLLPESLRELTILHYDIRLAGAIRLLARDPMVAKLDKFTVYHCHQIVWSAQDWMEDPLLAEIPKNIRRHMYYEEPRYW